MQLKRAPDEMSEKEYRNIRDRLSYSSIKLFDNDRKAFYNQLILGNVPREKETVSKTMGSLVHCFLAEQSFEDKFHLLSAVEPKGQMKLLVDNLYDRAMQSVIELEDGKMVIDAKFETLLEDAIQTTKYDYEGKEVNFKGKDFAKITSLFQDSDAEIYYREKLSAVGKLVVATTTITQAEKMVERLKSHSYTYEYANARNGGNLVVYNELAIMFEHGGVLYKSLLDKVIINKEDKTIQPLDWKTSWDNEEPKYAYLKFGYYLQAAMYNMALNKWAVEQGYRDFKILPMKFIFCDTAGFADPVVLDLSMDDIGAGWTGFVDERGYYYKGLRDLMTEIEWHSSSGNWATSKTIYDNKGHMDLVGIYNQILA